MSLPSYLETHMAIVGTTGAGKTVTGKGYVEQLLAEGRQVIVLDPTGAWWGMQSNSAGDGPGIRIFVFGGLHANAPIDVEDGVQVAELLIERRVSAIIDLSEMDEEEQRSFSLAFIGRLRTKPIGNLHLVIDEADEIAPAIAPDSDGWQLTRALAWIAKRGRIRGFVLTVITQRPTELAKSVLALAQTMVIQRLIAPQDQAPIDRYLKSHAAAATRKEVLGSLAALKRGERWIYSPVEEVLERGMSPALTTFDSSAAPIPGQQASEPRALADVDFAGLAEALAAGRPAPDPIAEAETREPGAWKQLLARVDALEALIAHAPIERCQVPGCETPTDRGICDDCDDWVTDQVARLPRSAPADLAVAEDALLDADSSPAPVGGSDTELKALVGLAAVYPAGLTEAAWAQRTGYSRKGGAWIRRRKRYLDAQLVEQRNGRWFATAAGVDHAGAEVPDMPPPGRALVAWWGKRVSTSAARRALDLLAAVHPKALTRDAIAAELRMAREGGAFLRAIRELKAAELATEARNRIAVAPALMGAE